MAQMDSVGPLVRSNYQRSGIYPRTQMNTVGRMLSHIKGRDGIRVHTTQQEIIISGKGLETRPCRFDIEIAGANSVRVTEGVWTRRGIEIDLDVDVGKTYKTLTGFTLTDETYTVYLELERIAADKDPALVPDKLEAKKATEAAWNALIATNEPRKIYWKLGEVFTNSDGNITHHDTWWCGGDINDFVDLPDSDEQVATAPQRSTIAWNSYAGSDHDGELELHGVGASTASSYNAPYFDAGALVASKGVSGTLSWAPYDVHESGATQKSIEINNRVQLYDMDQQLEFAMDDDSRVFFREHIGPELRQTNADSLVDWIINHGDLIADLIAAGLIDAIIAEGIEHHELLPTWGDYDDHEDGPYKYMLLGNPDDITKANMYIRNTGESGRDHYLADSLWIQLKLIAESTEDITPGNGATGAGQFSGGVSVGDRLQVLDTTASTSATTGCGLFYGGIGVAKDSYFGDMLEVNDGTRVAKLADGAGSRAGYFTDGTNYATLADAVRGSAGTFLDGTYTVALADNTFSTAGYFSDGTDVLLVADGTYAANATAGGINVATGQGYYVNDIQVVTDQQPDVGLIADTTGAANDGTARAKINAIRTVMQTHGMMA